MPPQAFASDHQVMYTTASPSSIEEDFQSMSTTSSSASSNPPTQDTSMVGSFFNSLTSPSLWSEKDVKSWLAAVGFPDIAEISEENGIDGAVLMHLDSETLRDLGIIKVGRRLRLIRLINELEASRHGPPNSRDRELKFSHVAPSLKLDSKVLNTFSHQNERISQLEDELWELRALTDSLRDRSNSIAGFNLDWATDSSHKQTSTLLPVIEVPSSKSRSINALSSARSYTQPPPVFVTRPSRTAPDNKSDPPMSELDLCPPASLSTRSHRRRSNSGPHEVIVAQDASVSSITSSSLEEPGSILVQNNNNSTPKSRHQFPSNAQTHPESLNNPWSRNIPTAPKPSLNRQSSHSLTELRKKFSAPTFEPCSASDLSPAMQTPRARANSSAAQPGLMVARKPSLLTRGARSPMVCGAGGTANCMSPTHITEEMLDTGTKSQVKDKSYAVNRSASTSKLRTAQSTPSFQPPPNTETSVRVKSNNAETVIEVLIGHLSSFYVNDPHAWSKHVLIVRKQQTSEQSLSYDEIPLKVYRSFRSRDGVDFAIRSIDDLPSPLRSIRASRKRENRSMSFELLAVDLAEDEEEADAARRPLPFGLAICSYQSDIPDELSIKPGHSFKIKEKSKTRYLVERDCSSTLSTSPLSAVTSSASSFSMASPSPTRTINSNIDITGWVPRTCILESSQSISSFSPKGACSLKDLISNPIKTSEDIFDQSQLTSPKICLISFQTQSLNWSGELLHLRQGEVIRAFNSKTRLHWTYCIRESTGERGWCPNWILSSNLQVFTQGSAKLREYLRDQQCSISDRVGSGDSGISSPKPIGAFRSGSLRGTRGPLIGGARSALRPKQTIEDVIQSTETKSGLQRSATHGDMRAINFTPRSRRSRIAPTQT